MNKILLSLGLLFLTSAGTLHAVGEGFSFTQDASEKQVFVNNRILAKVNGKAISVIDVMKKMDLLFYRQYPQYTSNPVARFQFYQISWTHVLQELIDKELIMADALENKLPISTGDVRQELENLFGPNIIINLDKVNLTFDEAWKMVQEDITLKRMLYVRVQGKAMKKVTPQDVRIAYEEFAKNNMRQDQWNYQVVTIRNPDPVKGAETAQYAYQLLTEQKVPLKELSKQITGFAAWSSKTKLTVSEEFQHNQKDLAPNYKDILVHLTTNSYSEPKAQQSRSDKSMVYRIFFLKEMVPGGVVPFSEVEARLTDQLRNELIDQESTAYLKKLRRHNNVQLFYSKETAGDFEPFVLK